jgi:cell fate regulator YaaT (PSP1 superfamily)
MTKVVGVRFRQVGKIYFFAPGKYSVETGQHVMPGELNMDRLF